MERTPQLHIAEVTRVCPDDPVVCEEMQLKMIIPMGIKDAELIQKLISMDSTSPSQDVVVTFQAH